MIVLCCFCQVVDNAIALLLLPGSRFDCVVLVLVCV